MQALAETAIGQFISNIDENENGMRTTKMAGQEKAEGERITGSAQLIRRYTYKLMRTHALTPPVIDLFHQRSCICWLVGGGGIWLSLINLIWTGPP